MKGKFLILLSIVASTAILSVNCNGKEKCPEGINLLPMYGNVQKCKEQLESDARFLENSDKEEPNRAKAAIMIMDNGWFYLHKGDYDTAMKRINQAWLLDSTNIVVYASFTVLLDITQKTEQAIKMLDTTLQRINNRADPVQPTQMNPSNQMYYEFIVDNLSFVYRKKNNPELAKYLYAKLDTLNISNEVKERLKNKLKTDIPEIN